jgi:hypothetical protein
MPTHLPLVHTLRKDLAKCQKIVNTVEILKRCTLLTYHEITFLKHQFLSTGIRKPKDLITSSLVSDIYQDKYLLIV